MTVHPSATSLSSTATARYLEDTQYLEDLFIHLRACSRSVNASDRAAEAAIEQHAFDSELVDHENNVGRFLAQVAPAAVERMHLVQVIAPGYAEDLCSLEPARVDALVRPVFEAAGVVEDFMPWQERFPRRAAEEAAAASS